MTILRMKWSYFKWIGEIETLQTLEYPSKRKETIGRTQLSPVPSIFVRRKDLGVTIGIPQGPYSDEGRN